MRGLFCEAMRREVMLLYTWWHQNAEIARAVTPRRSIKITATALYGAIQHLFLHSTMI
jgi:hypothetical protein